MSTDAWEPLSNATLTFSVVTGYSIDPITENSVETTEELTYIAYLRPTPPSRPSKDGIDLNTIQCEGRLLHPPQFDPRIQNGSEAKCLLNGVQGSFEVDIPLAMQLEFRQELHQPIQGVFEAVGKGSFANV